jgi:hypothetical protein
MADYTSGNGCHRHNAAENSDDVRVILSIIAFEKGLRIHGKFLVNYSEDEMLDIQSAI